MSERWKQDLDRWITREEPEDEEDDHTVDCWHEDHETDILTGRATCNACGYAWWQTKEEIEREIERIREYDEWTQQQERPWSQFKTWLCYTRPVQWYWNWRWRGMVKRDFDDEVPF